MQDCKLISAMTIAFGTDGINRVIVVKKLINDGARIIWNVKKVFFLSMRQRVLVSSCQWVLDQHKSEVKKVSSDGQDDSAPEYGSDSYQLDDRICTPPATCAETGLQITR